ncbi:MAG: hypothetical protein C6W54_00555 [Bacillaceae bacterium]|nr:MAG: hypothetical protein C6W54_00555 [Bacillaceae bacterium]
MDFIVGRQTLKSVLNGNKKESSTPNRAKIPGDRRLFQIFIEHKQIKGLIKIPLFVKIKITSQALKMKCLFNNIFWGFYLNYEELKQRNGETR